MAVANLINFAVWPTLSGLVDSYNSKMVCFGEEAMELCMHEKAILFLSVNILMVWCAGFLGRTMHYRVS